METLGEMLENEKPKTNRRKQNIRSRKMQALIYFNFFVFVLYIVHGPSFSALAERHHCTTPRNKEKNNNCKKQMKSANKHHSRYLLISALTSMPLDSVISQSFLLRADEFSKSRSTSDQLRIGSNLVFINSLALPDIAGNSYAYNRLILYFISSPDVF